MKVILVKTQNTYKPCIAYNNEPLETVESFEYLGLKYGQAIKFNFSYGGHAQGWSGLPSKAMDAQEMG